MLPSCEDRAVPGRGGAHAPGAFRVKAIEDLEQEVYGELGQAHPGARDRGRL